MEKNCSKCGTPFGCKAEGPGCWCESLQVAPETLAQLRGQYDNCLCPSCLQQFAVDATPVQALPEQTGGH